MILFRKQLLLDSDPQAIAKAKAILQENGIAFEVKTTVSENVLSRNFNAKAAQYRFEAYNKVSTQSYLYYLYVKRRDYQSAKELIG